MSGSPKEKLQQHTGVEETTDEREVYLRDGRKLVLSEQGTEQLVEIRNESGMLEVRIRLTEEGPVLQMESARLSLKASEAIEIESKRVEIKGTEKIEMTGGEVQVTAEQNEETGTNGEIKIVGAMIYLN